jgi:dynein heavy chain
MITKNIYSNVSRGLFETDKLLFTYLIATAVDRAAGLIEQTSWNILLRGAQPIPSDKNAVKPANPMPKQLTELNYDTLWSAACLVEHFEGIVDDIRENSE